MEDKMASLLSTSRCSKSNNCVLMTSRFNNQTYGENENYRKQHQKIGCIYCTEERVSLDVEIDKIMFVLEMNNETNQIMGIGMVRNRTSNSRHIVYNNFNYNRYNYVGKHRICRDELDEWEEITMKILDRLCFTGRFHMKRGQGLRMFPMRFVNNLRRKKNIDVVELIRTMFKRRINNNT